MDDFQSSHKIVNLCGHEVCIKSLTGKNGEERWLVIPASQRQARVVWDSDDGFIEDGSGNIFRAVVRRFARVVGLPPRERGTLYIVSSLVRTTIPERTDLISPDTGSSAIKEPGTRNVAAVERFVMTDWENGTFYSTWEARYVE